MKERVLIIGGVPGKTRCNFGGATILMQNFLSYLDDQVLPYSFIQTNRFRSKEGEQRRLLNKIYFFAKFFIVLPFYRVIMFNFSDNATIKMFPFLLTISHCFKKKVVLRKFAGTLEFVLNNVSAERRKKVLTSLGLTDLIFLETKSAIKYLNKVEPRTVGKTIWFPNVRESCSRHKDSSDFNKRLAFFGHVRDEKGVGDLLQLAKYLPQDYTIEIYGRIVVDKYKDYNWESHGVKYMGEVSMEGVMQILPTIQLLLLPSYSEGYPGVIIEAFSAGVPVVASSVGGIPEMIEDGKNGRLHIPGDINGLCNAVLSINSTNYPNYCQSALSSFYDNYFSQKVNERIYSDITSLFRN